MKNNFTASIIVDQSPEEVFQAVNNVRGWWTENAEGNFDKLNDEFSVRFGEVHYSNQKLIDMQPGKKVTWLVTDCKLNFIKDQQEWTNTKIHFDITPKGNQTELRFTHEGLNPEVECYDACSNAWGPYITSSLKKLIAEGKGTPTV
ncbi:SRPBCC family protein [Taibaiella soli]|uniref:SRPBCC domain-containing protein n=1 Tax=Taibaiella soli TaxID=1649169 RepID=A0A2W2B505_9BACT|nr:SRPBCC domain-containing protein [Taibaiella soli]PZF71167.1 SRPBCC domain-containing protein [Taibaiella soli]